MREKLKNLRQQARRQFRAYYRTQGTAERLVRCKLEVTGKSVKLSGWHGVVCTPIGNDEAEFRKVRLLPDGGGVEVGYVNMFEESLETAAFHLLEPADQIAVMAEVFGIN